MSSGASKSQLPKSRSGNNTMKGTVQRDRPLQGDSLCEVDKNGNISNHAMHAIAMSEEMDDACTAYARKLLGDKADSYGSLFQSRVASVDHAHMSFLGYHYTFPFHIHQRDRFRSGELVKEWRHRYPQIFDVDDDRVLKTEHQRQYHFFEWLTAVLIYESTGYLSLVAKYTTKSHPLKRAILQSLLTPALDQWLCSHESGQPDLFVYHPDTRDWYFCEVKGGADRMRANQIKWMNDFNAVLGGEGISPTGKTRVISLTAINANGRFDR